MWLYGDTWGEEKYAVRNWLQEEWEENVGTKREKEFTEDTLRTTKDDVLDVSNNH